jgi:hypothetical protein
VHHQPLRGRTCSGEEMRQEVSRPLRGLLRCATACGDTPAGEVVSLGVFSSKTPSSQDEGKSSQFLSPLAAPGGLYSRDDDSGDLTQISSIASVCAKSHMNCRRRVERWLSNIDTDLPQLDRYVHEP